MRGKRWKVITGVLAVLGGGFALSAASSTAASASGPTTETAQILIPGTASASIGGFYAAAMTSVAKKEHLKLEFPPAGPGNFDTIPQVAAGQYPFSLTDAGFIYTARDSGTPVVQVFAPYNSPVCLMSHPAEHVKTFTDLNGKDVEVTASAPYWLYLKNKYHLHPAKTINYFFSLAPWISDKNMVQQCFITNEPFVASHEGYPNTALLVNKSGFNDYDDVLFTTENEIKTHPKLVSDVVHAVLAGWQDFWANPGPTDKVLPSYGDQETRAQMAYEHKELLAIDTHPVGYAKPIKMEQSANQLYSVNVIKKSTLMNWKAAFTNSFLGKS
jgi:NitT/TauT family transport system substrate-binding protein